MTIQHLDCTEFRNLRSISMDFSSDLNLILGPNGAGKTSILEAIYYLSHGKSFRSTKNAGLIHRDANAFSIFTQVIDSNNRTIPIGVSRSIHGKAIIKRNHEKISSISEVAKLLPVKFICSMSHLLLTSGPRVRRAFLDWGLFHVKHDFHRVWKTYNKVLSSRNALIKTKQIDNELDYWDQALLESGACLDQYRKSYVSDIIEFFNDFLFLQSDINAHISFKYDSGWGEQADFSMALQQNRYKDFAVGYTSAGPHRADLLLTYDGVPVADILSQGQLKILSYRLHLIQGLLLKKLGNISPIYLVDDLGSELDDNNVQRILAVLSEMEAQHIVSCINQPANTSRMSMFHVKHGIIAE